MVVPAIAADKITLHGASQFSDDHAYNRTLIKFQELVNEYYDGEVEFILHGNSELGLEKDFFAYLTQGISVDYAIVAPSHMSTFAKAAPLMDMPFLFRDLEHSNKVLASDALKPIADEVQEKADVLLVGFAGGGIVGGVFTPTEASGVAVVYTLIVGVFVYRSITIRQIPKVLYDSARFAAISLFCVGTASAFGWILAYFQIPRALVGIIEGWGGGLVTTGFICAGAFLTIGMFIDAIPAIIILGTILWPVTQKVGMHPIHFAIIGVISLAFGLVTPPYGLCLLISCSLGKIKLVDALKDVIIILIPMILVLIFVILFPDVILFLPRLFLAKYL